MREQPAWIGGDDRAADQLVPYSARLLWGGQTWKASVGRSFLLTLPESRAISHCCACLPLGLRKWMEGHLGTAGGLEIPRGFRHPGSIPQSVMSRLPAAPVGKVKLIATVRQVERAALFIVTVFQ